MDIPGLGWDYYDIHTQGGGSSTSPTKLSNGSKEGSSGKTKEAKREGKEKLKVMNVMLGKVVMVMLMM